MRFSLHDTHSHVKKCDFLYMRIMLRAHSRFRDRPNLSQNLRQFNRRGYINTSAVERTHKECRRFSLLPAKEQSPLPQRRKNHCRPHPRRHGRHDCRIPARRKRHHGPPRDELPGGVKKAQLSRTLPIKQRCFYSSSCCSIRCRVPTICER